MCHDNDVSHFRDLLLLINTKNKKVDFAVDSDDGKIR